MTSRDIIKETLLVKNMTQKDLADALGLQRTAVNRRLAHDGDMKVSTLLEMLAALGFTLHVTKTVRDTTFLIREVTDK